MHSAAIRTVLVLALAGVVAGCVDIPNAAPPAVGVMSLFDSATATIPLPNDLLKDPKTGLLSIPASPTDSPLTLEVKDSLARLDGWLTSQTITIPFDGELDPASLTAESVLVFDLTTGEQLPFDSFYAAFNVGVEPAVKAPYTLMIKNKTDPKDTAPLKLPMGYAQGHKYFAVLTSGVKGKDGKPVTADAVYELLKCTAPLADAQGRSLTVLSPTDPAGIAQLLQLEYARSAVYDPAFKAVEKTVTRDKAVAFTVFSIQGGPRAVFNPTLVGNRLPEPIDLAKKGPYPLDTPIAIYYDLPIDQATVPAGVKMYELGAAGGTTPVNVDAAAAASADATGLYRLTITPQAALKPAATYLVVTTDSIVGTNKIQTAALAYFSIVRYANPLIDESVTPAKLNSPFLDSTIDLLITTGYDPRTATADNWQGAYDFLILNLRDLETLRLLYAPLFAAAVAAGTPRETITALWSFTTAAN